VTSLLPTIVLLYQQVNVVAGLQQILLTVLVPVTAHVLDDVAFVVGQLVDFAELSGLYLEPLVVVTSYLYIERASRRSLA
jgi:hypothetical protein